MQNNKTLGNKSDNKKLHKQYKRDNEKLQVCSSEKVGFKSEQSESEQSRMPESGGSNDKRDNSEVNEWM